MSAFNSAATQINGYGEDSRLENRPGVPMELEPRPMAGVHWQTPEKQIAKNKIFKRVGLEDLTPVFGSAQPPRGISGVLRAAAYRMPEHEANHWALLLFADRVDVVEGRIVDAFTRKPWVGLWAIGGIVGYLAFKNRRKSDGSCT